MLKLKILKMCKLKFGSPSLFLSVLVLLTSRHQTKANEGTHYMPPLECYDPYGRPQRCLPEFVNAGYQLPIEATNTCGRYGDQEFCVQTGYSNQKSCDICTYDTHPPEYLTDLHDPQNPTWWQSETMFEGVQQRNQVNLTLHLGKSFDITYIRIVFYSPRPESFAIYKRVTENGQWIPYQYYSSTCRDTYNLPDSLSVEKGNDESRALCTSEYSDISPLRDGNIAFSSLEGRPSATNFENSPALQSWVTATDIRIVLDRLNTFGDEVFGDPQVLKSYFFAIADIAVGARCKCNGHASKCVTSTGLNGERTLVCECKHNTDGPDCEKCLPLYNDVEWRRATSKNVNECKPCNCNGYSEKCFFDSHLFNLTGHGGHCVDCKENRDGSNCERCKENFYMRDDGYCIHCGCHPTGSRSLQCNTEGRCQCKPGVTGEKCDRCEANFYQFGPHGCQPCGCDVRGSFDNTPSCDSETGVCRCKEHVEGRRCKECKPGFFNIDLDNRFGCTPCFCYGHTSECQSAGGYSVFSITSNFNKHQERWTAIDNYNRKVDIKHNPYSQSIGTIAQGNDFIYFSASDRFLGDQRASYNRFLKFRLQLVDQIGPSPSSSDVILEGAGARISLPIFAQGNNLPDEQSRLYAFRLHEHPDYSWQPSQSARGFMSILSNLTAVKIRASYALQGEAILDNVELQTAHRGAAGQPATWIEQCTCPDGYLGQFCESCAPGYRHIPARGGPFQKCVLCDCNKHAEICDSETGRCICQHNTAGDTCDQCARGYFGNALGGTQHDCKRCPCPDNGACLQMPDDSVICTECPTGYFGQKCEQCSDGFYGDPHGIHGNVRKCQACECNGNVDLNAVGNCNRTTGECLKCIYNTAGPHCDQCLPGYFGDPLALPHGQCDRCSCYLQGTEQTDDGISQCDQLSGNCKCKPNVFGRNCDNCEPGYFNIVSGNGCESCFCDPIGSYNSSCDLSTGQCYCKPGVTGLRCNECEKYYYGFSTEGCKSCDCDESGSKGYQCDKTGQCPCNDNVEGKRCDRCKENKYNRHEGCLNCPFCYNLVQDAADDHRAKLKNLTDTLENISITPVTNDEEFDAKLKVVSEKIDILLDDAKAGAGGGDQTLVERLHDLQKKLDKIQKLLDESAKHKNTADRKYEQAQKNFTEANKIIENIKAELNEAVDLLKAEGSQALQRAEKKKTGYGNHSDPISAISRDARNRAIQLKSEAEFKLDKSKEANDAALKAYDLARSALTLQKNISNELRSDVRFEMAAAKETLEKTKQLTQNAVKMANETYDTALTLFTTVDGITVPEIDITKLKADSADAYEQAEALEAKVRRITEDNESAAFAFDEEVELSDLLLKRAHIQKEEDIGLLKDAQAAYEEALKAVQLGDSTLKDANATYNKIAGFQAEFKNLSAIAELSLQNVPAIRQDITDANQLIQEADDALQGAKENVNETLKNARDAQEKYAEQASRDAEKIRIKANETKVDARKLRSEADQLNNRVAVTEQSISILETDSTRDDKLINEVKRKVAQAKTDSFEAQSLARKALDEISEIMEELKNFRDINSSDLNLLERRLEAAEQELYRTNITERLKQVRDLRNKQQMWAEQYEKEASLLKDEVSNIKNIKDSLPSGCFNQRSKLEP